MVSKILHRLLANETIGTVEDNIIGAIDMTESLLIIEIHWYSNE